MHVASIRLGSLFVASFTCVLMDEHAGEHVCALVQRIVGEAPSDIVLDFRPHTVVTPAGARWLRRIRAELPDGTQLVVSGLSHGEATRLRTQLGASNIHVVPPHEHATVYGPD
jgi:hypothetical protein